MMYECGDKVVSLGDAWMTKGSEGEVLRNPPGGTVTIQVMWTKIKTKRHKSGIIFYHNIKDIASLEDNSTWKHNPNIAFKYRKKGKGND